MTRVDRRTLAAPGQQRGRESSQGREMERSEARALTLYERPVLLADNVRNLLDWLVEEELRRWLHEER